MSSVCWSHHNRRGIFQLHFKSVFIQIELGSRQEATYCHTKREGREEGISAGELITVARFGLMQWNPVRFNDIIMTSNVSVFSNK